MLLFDNQLTDYDMKKAHKKMLLLLFKLLQNCVNFPDAQTNGLILSGLFAPFSLVTGSA